MRSPRVSTYNTTMYLYQNIPVWSWTFFIRTIFLYFFPFWNKLDPSLYKNHTNAFIFHSLSNIEFCCSTFCFSTFIVPIKKFQNIYWTCSHFSPSRKKKFFKNNMHIRIFLKEKVKHEAWNIWNFILELSSWYSQHTHSPSLLRVSVGTWGLKRSH